MEFEPENNLDPELKDEDALPCGVRIQQELLNSSPLRKTSLLSTCSKVTLMSLGLVSGLPYLNRATAYAHGNKALAGLYGYSIVASIGGLTTWAYLDITKTMLDDSIKCNCHSVFIAAVLGVISACPITIISIIYDESLF